MQDELAHDNFQVIAVAIDENVEAVRGFVDGITYPVLMDPEHVLTELYAISNVPSVILIDVDDTIRQPNWNAYATDTFRDFTKIDSSAQVDIVRQWVLTGSTMMTADEAKDAVGDLAPEEEDAKLHFRIGNHLRSLGDETGASRNYDLAAALAPHDWTNRRAMIPLRGGDPFGEEFFSLAGEYIKAGQPYHGVAATRSDD